MEARSSGGMCEIAGYGRGTSGHRYEADVALFGTERDQSSDDSRDIEILNCSVQASSLDHAQVDYIRLSSDFDF